MKEFELAGEDVLVRRGVVDSFVSAFGSYRVRGERVVMRHLGIEEIPEDPDALFSMKKFLGAMKELQTQFGLSFMQKVGTFIFDKAIFPPGLDSIEKAMASVDAAYNMNNVDAEGKIGSYRWTLEGERRGSMFCDNPFPCAFDRGILESIATRFAGSGAKVQHVVGSCRAQNGESCTYDVEW